MHRYHARARSFYDRGWSRDHYTLAGHAATRWLCADAETVQWRQLMPTPENHQANPSALARAWGLEVRSRFAGGVHNAHWLARRRGTDYVLRRYGGDHFADLAFEWEVMKRCRALGWPVTEVLDTRVDEYGCTWCLLSLLPGSPKAGGPKERRDRGRLLAEFHESTNDLRELGQREGFVLGPSIIDDPQLSAALGRYEVARPRRGYLLRWYADQAREGFAHTPWSDAEQRVIHSDFTNWNLLFEDDVLTGVLDFEAAHLNFRVADFATAAGHRHRRPQRASCPLRHGPLTSSLRSRATFRRRDARDARARRFSNRESAVPLRGLQGEFRAARDRRAPRRRHAGIG